MTNVFKDIQGLPPGFPLNSPHNIHGQPLGFTPNIQKKEKSDRNKSIKSAVFYYGDSGGCAWWRMQLPELLLNYSKRGNIIGLNKLIPDPRFYDDVNCVRLQRQASPYHLKFYKHLKEISKKNNMKIIYEIDDIIFREDIPNFNIAIDAYRSDEVYKGIIEMMKMSDMITTTTDYLKQYYEERIGTSNIKVIKNMGSKMWFDMYYDNSKIMKSLERHQKKPRVLYAGSGNHFNLKRKKDTGDDFTHVVETIKKTINDFQWIFMGGYPYELKPYVDSGKIELHKWENICNYPKKIYDLDVNAVIAPLTDCHFNRAKSNIKYLESAYLGIPGVFQNIITYKDAPFKFDTGDEMIDQLKKLLTNRQLYAKISKKSRSYANTMWLDDHIGIYEDIMFG